ncbi:IS3 family transposase, partial [Undibacterium flavidum]
KAQIVDELRQQYPIAQVLEVVGMARSTFYYQHKQSLLEDKHAVIKQRIRAIYDKHHGRYGYRRVTAAIRQLGELINHKTVQRLMK